jgi:hypothetical protein
MANAFTNFLKNVSQGIFEDDGATMKDYQHGDRLFVDDNFSRSPKLGFLYFINFNINQGVVIDQIWNQKGRRDVGLLVKRADLPKFKIQTETLNQYNRKTVVQSKINYNPVVIEFHDDNSDITHDLWKNYYNYYYADGLYGILSATEGKNIVPQYGDTKYQKDTMAPFGLNSYQTIPFFNSIDLYVLHKSKGPQDFTQYTLINPLVTDWAHDSLNVDENGKILSNRMTLAYEAVVYKSGRIVRNSEPIGFTPVYYDASPSPLGIGAGSLFGPGGTLDAFGRIFGSQGTLANARTPLDLLGTVLQAKQLRKGSKNITSDNVKEEGYSTIADAVSRGLKSTKTSTGITPPSESLTVAEPKKINNRGG